VSGWSIFKLNEVYSFTSGLSKKRDEFGFGYPFLTFKQVFHNFFLPSKLGGLANTTERERERCSIKRGDVFLTRTSETHEDLGMSSVALDDYPNATYNGFTKRLRPKFEERILPEYAGYYFRSPNFRAAVTSMSSVTTRASLNNDMLSALSIVLPPFEIQISIAKVLKRLDDKIDLLERQNKTLEELAQTLFRQWFVEKAEDGWEEIVFEDIIDTQSGYNHKSSQIVEKGDILLSMGSIVKSYGIESTATRQINSEGIDNRYRCKPGDIVITTRDVTQNADLLGSPGIIPTFFEFISYKIKIRNSQ